MKRFYLQLALILPFISLLSAQTQTVERQKLITAYTYSFAKNIKWKDGGQFNIHVITTDPELIKEFKYLSSTRNLESRPIITTFSSSLIVPQGIDVIFVGSEFNQATRSILNQVNGNPVLSITDGFDDSRFIMINFLQSDPNTLEFEINRANIINQGLGILPDMVLLGGNEVDVAQLYREAQDSLVAMENRILNLQERSEALTQSVAASKALIEKQAQLIEEQTNDINTKQETAHEQQLLLDSLMDESTNSENRLDSLVQYLNAVRGELSNVENELKSQQQSMRQGDEILEAQSLLMDEREKEIIKRESQIREMETVVLSQKNALFFFFIFSAILVLFSIITYRAYTARRKAARKLAAQKQELSELLDELKEAQSQLVQSEKMASLGVLIAGIAHEINNAINFVYSGIHIIKSKFAELNPVIKIVRNIKEGDKDIDDKVKKIVQLKEELQYNESQSLIVEMIKNVQIGAERTTEIVKGLRTFSRGESEEKALVDIHEDIDVALLLLESRHKNHVIIEKKFADNAHQIEGYQGQLGQVFLNLIGNAIDAVEGKGDKAKVTIRTRFKKHEVEVVVKDNGYGIESDILDRIFDPFFTTKGIGTGTGLGLSITYGIIEKHNGNIQVKSTPGKGAEFIITLPVK